MKRAAAASKARGTPYLRERDGELSLHFDRRLVQSCMSEKDPEALVLDYCRTMMAFLLLQPKPQCIAMIGLGGGSLAKYCHRHLPDTHFTAVEIDPRVLSLRDRFHIPPNGPRLRVIRADGAEYVRSEPGTLDVLLVDGFDGGGQPPQLCSDAFYADCAAKLRAGGVLAVNYWAEDPDITAHVRALRACFDGQVVLVDSEERGNRIAFACTGHRFPPSATTLERRARVLRTTHAASLQPSLKSFRRRLEGFGRATRRAG
ncbi:MAG: fused MFS/spermidine synthase [Gammaproteobacteria bacterium]|nr:fused MFS/spermidine synthase [Gammaproteobacteria bacterium]